MSRYVYFYALNSKQGKKELYDDLTSATKYPKSFADFIAERTAECGRDFGVTYEQVTKSVQDHFEDLLPSQLYEIVGWYKDIFYQRFCNAPNYEWERYREAVTLSLRCGGIEPLFEITGSSTNCYAFIQRYGDFETQYELDVLTEDEDEGSNIKSYEFIRFLDYMVLLMCEIHDANLYDSFNYNDLSEGYQNEIKHIRLKHQNNFELLKFVNKKLEHLKKAWTHHKETGNGPYSTETTIYDHYQFLEACLNMKATIKKEHTRVLMVNG